MVYLLSRLAAEHFVASIFAALAICLIAGSLLGELLRRSQHSRGSARAIWLAGTAIVAGLGVWTTHFVAILGYRPDLPLNYGLEPTLLSAAIGVLAVGLPLAAGVLVRSPVGSTLLGGVAGLGISVMHFTGMSALDGCRQIQSPGTVLLAGLFGAAVLSIGRGVPAVASSNRMTCLVYATAVYGTHFVAMSGLTLIGDAAPSLRETDQTILSLLVFAGALALFVGALLALLSARRFDAQEKTHVAILSTALQNMSNGLVFVDANGRLELYNDRFREMFELRGDALRIGMALGDLVEILADAAGWDAAKRQWCRDHLMERLRTNSLRPTDEILPNGRIVEVDGNPVAGGGIVLTFDDVTDARAAQNELSRLALHDALTGLANRRALRRSMEEAIAGQRATTLVVLGLDRFRIVNETYGHVVGDQILVQVAERLKAVSGNDAVLGRLGGDEMALVASGDAASAADLAGDIIEAIARPFQIGDIATAIGCSIGIVPIVGSDTPEELMQRADIALSEAKRQGRGRFATYRTGLQEAAALRHRLIADLRTALPRGEFHLAYQPVVSLEDDEILGYEALLRWDHPELGAVSPAVFVPLAEESGEILAIGEWVLGEACRTAAGWTTGRHVAVNVSTVQFRSPRLRAHVVSALARSGLPAHRLEIELTETALVEDGAQIAHILCDLRQLGIKVAMDDFGTGYSSLAHISTFPVDRIKIDRSFVASAESDRHSLAVIKAVLLLGRDLDIATLAEGVETPSQLQLLRDLGCGSVQGYLLGRPMRLEAPKAAAATSGSLLAQGA